jgi:nucleotide-binding universal stress UspA family protein
LDVLLIHIIRLPEGKQPALANYLRQERNIEAPAVLVRESAQVELARLGERLTAEAGVAITCEVRDGDPAAGIVAAAGDHHADLIAIGHRGHGKLAQMVVGSVARRVIETAPCPVLVVR